MAFADDLLEQANHLARREKKKPRQASLRRAVSTGYYALFHLLTAEAARNWRIADQRPSVARLFDHGRMKSACTQMIASQLAAVPEADRETVLKLKGMARTFEQAQQQRHAADYDNSKQWTRKEVLSEISGVEGAFRVWSQVRKHPRAQHFLLSLLGNPRRG